MALAEQDLSQLALDLHLRQDAKSAAMLGSLLDYAAAGAGEKMMRGDLHEILTWIALDTAAAWCDESSVRAQALHVKAFQQHLNQIARFTGNSEGPGVEPSERMPKALRVLLRLCVNCDASCQATLEADVLTGLLSIIAQSKGTECPGLASAVLAVCLMQLPDERRNEDLIPVIVKAVLAFLGGASAPQGANAPQGGALGEFSIDAEAIYMAGALLQLLRRGNEDVWLMSVTQADLLSKLLVLTPMLLAAEHDLGISIALGLIVPLAQGNFSSKTDIMDAGLITQVMDLLSREALPSMTAATAVQPQARRTASQHLQLRSDQQNTELLLSALAFLSTVLEDFAPGVAQVLSTHPGPPLNALLRHPSYLVTCNLCSVIASAADEHPAMQRLLRLDGVITTVMQALEERAAAISVGLHADEHPAEPALLEHVDVVVSAGVALCATINASPDNHMYMANSGNVRHVVDALMIVASADRTRISAALSRHLDLACAELTTVLSVLSRNMMNRSMLVTPTSINVMAAVVTCSRPAEKDCLFLGDSAVRAIKEVLYVLVSLVNLDSNVARHLEDLPDFLPHLFRFIRQGAECPALENAAALVLVIVRECKLSKTMLTRVGVPDIMACLSQHASPFVSSTTVQALSGVLTLLAMSRSMLELLVRNGGIKLFVEMLGYHAPAGEGVDTASASAAEERACSVQEAACVLLGCLADASSRARSKILRCRGVVQRLIKQVCSVPDSEVTNLLARAALSPMVACSPAHLRHGTDPGEGDTNEAHVASVAAASSKCALVATLAKLMQNAGPDNFVFQAAMQAMNQVDPDAARQAGFLAETNGGEASSYGECTLYAAAVPVFFTPTYRSVFKPNI